MSPIPRIAVLAATLALAGAPALHAQPQRPDDAPGAPKNLPFAPKGARGAYNFGGTNREGPGDTAPYKSAREHFETLRKQASKLTAAQLPDWSGIWGLDGGAFNFDPSLARDATHYGPLSKANQAFYEKSLKDAENGKEWDNLSYCLPAGFPRWISEGFLRDFAVTPNKVMLINEQQSEVRRVYTDGRGHRPDDEAQPLWEGDSVGFWIGSGENAKLVIWTNNLKEGVYHRNGPRYSEKAETIEVMQKVDATHIKVDLTVYDPQDLTRPWTVHRGYKKDALPNGRIDLWSCEENNNVVRKADGGSDFLLPGEKGYKDPTDIAKPKS
jgi:hypothetical protein